MADMLKSSMYEKKFNHRYLDKKIKKLQDGYVKAGNTIGL